MTDTLPKLRNRKQARAARKRRRSGLQSDTISQLTGLLFPPDKSDSQWGLGRVVEALAEEQASPHGDLDSPSERFLRVLAKSSTAQYLLTGQISDSDDEARPASGEGKKRLSIEHLADMMERRWGAQFRDPSATLARLRSLPPVRMLEPGFTAFLVERSKVPGITPATWIHGQTYCALADIYLHEMIGYATKARRNGPEKEKIQQSLIGLIHPDSFDINKAVTETGQSWLSCGVHAGASRYGRWARKVIHEGRILRLGAGGRAGKKSYVSVRKRDDQARALMEMIRHLRKPGNLAGMAIDGQYGQSKSKVNVLGRQLHLASGASHAIYHSKCRNAFTLFRWRENTIVIDATEGPSPQAGESVAEWNDRWFASLQPWLEGLATGDPSNIRGHAGIWSQLKRNPADPEEDSD